MAILPSFLSTAAPERGPKPLRRPSGGAGGEERVPRVGDSVRRELGHRGGHGGLPAAGPGVCQQRLPGEKSPRALNPPSSLILPISRQPPSSTNPRRQRAMGSEEEPHPGSHAALHSPESLGGSRALWTLVSRSQLCALGFALCQGLLPGRPDMPLADGSHSVLWGRGAHAAQPPRRLSSPRTCFPTVTTSPHPLLGWLVNPQASSRAPSQPLHPPPRRPFPKERDSAEGN